MSFKQQKTTLLIIILLAVSLLLQGDIFFVSFGRDLVDIWGTMSQAGLWRSAYFSQSQKFANYVRFLNENIPEDGRVVLPPAGVGLKALGTTPIMQFFLAPREVFNCLAVDCIKDLSRENTYILVVGKFPAEEGTERTGRRLMFNNSWGLILPEDAPPGNPDAFRGFSSAVEVVWAVAWPALWLALLTAAGGLFVRRLLPGWNGLPVWVIGYGLALSALSAGLGMVSLAGVPLQWGTIILVTAVLLGGAVTITLIDAHTPEAIRSEARAIFGAEASGRRVLNGWQAIFLALGAMAAVVSIGQAYHATDEVLLWGAKGYGIAATGSVKAVIDWGTHTVNYPLHVPILIAGSRLLFSEVLPASKIVFSLYYLGLLFLAYNFWARARVRRAAAGLATLLFATVPIIFRHATIGYANLVLSFYLVAAVMVLTQALEPSEAGQSDRLAFLSGLLFAAAAWTRPEGSVMAWLGIALILGIAWARRWAALSLRLGSFLVAPLIVYALFWLGVKTLVYTRPASQSGLVQSAFTRILSGDLHLEETLYIVRSLFSKFFDIETWGLFGFVLIIFLLAAMIAPARGRRSAALMLWTGSLYVALTAGMYYLTSYDTNHDISWWVNSGLNRMIFPGIFLLWFGSVGRVQLFDDREGSSPTADRP